MFNVAALISGCSSSGDFHWWSKKGYAGHWGRREGGRRGTADQDSSQLAHFDILVLSQLAPKAFLGSTKQAEMGSTKKPA